MNINLTLPIQIVHIIVGVFFLRRLLVTPVVAAIVDRSEKRRALAEQSTHAQQAINAVVEQAGQEGRAFGEMYKALREPMPVPEEVPNTNVDAILSSTPSDVSAKSNIAIDEESVNRLVKEVTDGFV